MVAWPQFIFGFDTVCSGKGLVESIDGAMMKMAVPYRQEYPQSVEKLQAAEERKNVTE
jgi:hypothetical protein